MEAIDPLSDSVTDLLDGLESDLRATVECDEKVLDWKVILTGWDGTLVLV